jgi:hypothetical protein
MCNIYNAQDDDSVAGKSLNCVLWAESTALQMSCNELRCLDVGLMM